MQNMSANHADVQSDYSDYEWARTHYQFVMNSNLAKKHIQEEERLNALPNYRIYINGYAKERMVSLLEICNAIRKNITSNIPNVVVRHIQNCAPEKEDSEHIEATLPFHLYLHIAAEKDCKLSEDELCKKISLLLKKYSKNSKVFSADVSTQKRI